MLRLVRRCACLWTSWTVCTLYRLRRIKYEVNTAYRLDLSCSAALSGVHDVFHVLLLRGWLSNGVHADVPSIEIDGEAEYKVSKIKGHHESQGKMQYLTSFVGFDSSEDMWLSTAQLEHAPVLL